MALKEFYAQVHHLSKSVSHSFSKDDSNITIPQGGTTTTNKNNLDLLRWLYRTNSCHDDIPILSNVLLDVKSVGTSGLVSAWDSFHFLGSKKILFGFAVN